MSSRTIDCALNCLFYFSLRLGNKGCSEEVVLPYYRIQTGEASFVFGDPSATQLVLGLIALPASSSACLHVSGNRPPGNAYIEWPRVDIFSNTHIAVSLSNSGSLVGRDLEELTSGREESLVVTRSALGQENNDHASSMFVVRRDGREMVSAVGARERTLQLSITWRQGQESATLEVGWLRGAADAAAQENWWQGTVEFEKPLQIVYLRTPPPN